jgi:hypothetical protein
LYARLLPASWWLCARLHCWFSGLTVVLLLLSFSMLQEVKRAGGGAAPSELISRSQRWVEQNLPGFLSLLQKQGWQLDKLYLPRPEWTAQW